MSDAGQKSVKFREAVFFAPALDRRKTHARRTLERVGNTGKKYGIRVGSALKARDIEEDPRWMRAICA